MREKLQKQMPLMNPATDHDQAKELEAIDAILKNTLLSVIWFIKIFVQTGASKPAAGPAA